MEELNLVNMYDHPAPRPSMVWEEFPEGMVFDEYQSRAEAMGIPHTREHGRLLFEFAKLGSGEGYIVETGTYWMAGACYLAAGSKTARREKVITIDIDRGHQDTLYNTGFYDRFPIGVMRGYMNALMMGVQDWIISLRASVSEAMGILDVPIRLAHIDAGHDEANCTNDIVLIEQVLVSGGIMVFHDFSSPDVKAAIDKHVLGADWCERFFAVDDQSAYAVKR